MKDEISLKNVLVLNNKSLLRVLYNKILPLYVLVTFSPPNIPYIFLNEYNFGLLKFISRTKQKSVNNYANFNDRLELEQYKDTSELKYYDLKYV